MVIDQFLLFAVLEVIFLVGAYQLYVRIQRYRAGHTNGGQGEQQPVLTVDNYVQLLQTQILNAEAHLKTLQQRESPDGAQVGALQARLNLLRCERKVIDSCAGDEQKLWSAIGTAFADWVVDDEVPGAVETDASGSPAMVAALQQKLDASRQRIANLEQFRDNFFDIQLRLQAGEALSQRLHDEIDKTVPREEQSPALRDAMDELEAENETLLQQLKRIQHEFSEIIQDLGEQESALPSGSGVSGLANINKLKGNLNGSFENLDEGVEQIRQVLVVQEQRIQELYSQVDGLQLEVADQQRLRACIDEVSGQNRELTNVVAVLEEENAFLQEQISALLKEELKREEKTVAELAQHRQEFEDLVGTNAGLEKKLADMEQKYLDLFSRQQAGRQ